MKRHIRLLALQFLSFAVPLAVAQNSDFFSTPGGGNAGVFSGSLIAEDCSKMGLSPSDILDVNFLARALSPDVGGMLQTATGGTASHVQVAAFANSGGGVCVGGNAKPVDNFGLTGEKVSLSPVAPAILVEDNDNFMKNYASDPLCAFQMSAEDYVKTRDAAEALARQGKYAPLNDIDVEKAIKGGLILGAIAGAIIDNPQKGLEIGLKTTVQGGYERRGRYNPGISDDPSRKMSFPEYNCQYFALLFLLLAQNTPSFRLVQPYRMPGETAPQDSGADASPSDREADSAENTRPAANNDRNPSVGESGEQAGKEENAKKQPAPSSSATARETVGKTPEEVAIAYCKAQGARDFDKVKALSIDFPAGMLDEAIKFERDRERDEFYSQLVLNRKRKYGNASCTVVKTVTDVNDEEFAELLQIYDEIALGLADAIGQKVAAPSKEGLVMVKVHILRATDEPLLDPMEANIVLKPEDVRWRVLTSNFQGEPDFSWID